MNKKNRTENRRQENDALNGPSANDLEKQQSPTGRMQSDLSDEDTPSEPNVPRWRPMAVLLPGGITLVVVISVVLGIMFFGPKASLLKDNPSNDLLDNIEDTPLTDNQQHLENQNNEKKSTTPLPNTEQKYEFAPDPYDHSVYLTIDRTFMHKGIIDPNYSEQDLAERNKVYQVAEKLIQSGRFEQILNKEHIISKEPVLETFKIRSEDFNSVRKLVLKSTGLVWEDASLLSREAATLIVFEEGHGVKAADALVVLMKPEVK